jgi:hypothetical protein
MCFISSKSSLIHKIAKRDKKVYKYGREVSSDYFYSLFKLHWYKKNKINPTIPLHKEILEDDRGYIRIIEGYHSYSSLEALSKDWPVADKSRIQQFIIPCGAEYYQNSSGEIVSNQILLR